MIDRKFVGTKTPPHSVEVEKGRLVFFAKAIGEDNPVFRDEQAAKAAGFRSIPAPPTFLFCLNMMDQPDPFARYKEMGIDLGKVLHGEQSFKYYEPVCAGDKITFVGTISDIYVKKGGALEFIITDTTATNQKGALVAELRGVTVVRNDTESN